MDNIFTAKLSFLTAGVIALLAFDPANAADLTGTWLVQDRTAKVRIAPCSEAFCGSIVWLSQPNDSATGRPQTDKLNVNPQLRGRPMLGVPIIYGMQRGDQDNKWSGWIYNPDDGRTYNGNIELVDVRRLRVRGCFTIYCETEIWIRAD